MRRRGLVLDRLLGNRFSRCGTVGIEGNRARRGNAQSGPSRGRSSSLLRPGRTFRVVDAMSRSTTSLLGLTAALFLSSTGPMSGDPAREKRRPDQFGIIYQMGYAADAFPRDPAAFEKLLQTVKAAHYNTILCRHED